MTISTAMRKIRASVKFVSEKKMALTFEYNCQGCGDVKTNHELDSMVCKCGGDYRPSDFTVMQAVPFDAGWCPTLRQYVSSYSDQEKKALAFRSVDHPKGFVMLNNNRKAINQAKSDYKNREEIKKEIYAKKGLNYKPGSKVHFDRVRNTFVPQGTPLSSS